MAPPSRQERLQMRQRGAGARKVNSVDFGFSFGLTPELGGRSARRTPRPSNTSIRRPSTTPSRSGRQPSVQRSDRSASATIHNQEDAPENPVGLPQDEDAHVEEPAPKRRRTTGGRITEPTTPADYIKTAVIPAGISLKGSPNPASKPRRRTSGPAFVQIAEDPEDEPVPEQLAQNGGASNKPTQRAPEPEPAVTTLDQENCAPDEELGQNNSVSGGKLKRQPRKRRSIGQESGRRKKRLSNGSIQVLADELVQDNAAPESVEEAEWETMIGDESSLSLVESSKPIIQRNAVGRKRRKRKSIVLRPRKRRRSGELNTPRLVSPAQTPHDGDAIVRGDIEQDTPAEQTSSMQINIGARRRLSDASKSTTPDNGPTYEPEIEGDETYIDEGVSPEKPTPKAPSRKARSKARKDSRLESVVGGSSSRKADAASRTKKSSKSSFPILTHRMANVSALPTIIEEVQDDLDSAPSPNSVKSKFTDRPAPNAIDVLAQICRETIEATISKLSTTSGTTGARGLKRKRSALEAFSSEIDSRLFDMSVAVEHRLTMEARAKKAKKAKTDAQNEWMAIRHEREEIALKCDAIRAQNQMIEAEGKAAYELSEQLHALEMVVEKPDLDEACGATEGLEYLLRSIAMTVSGAAGAGDGLLARVRDYNLQLERTALVLEGRELD